MECPDETLLAELALGGQGPRRQELEAHLDTCEACRAAVVAVAVTDPRPAAAPDREDQLALESLVLEEPGRYEALGECGRGGQSRVLRVFDRRVGREMALKELESTGEAARARFLREVRIVGELAHPAVVPIHEVGRRRSGAPYYTMPLIDGRTLADVVASTPDPADRLRLLPQFVQICHAVAAAHAHGVIHRDIKPENIMLGRFGEALLLDWGLAKFTDDSIHTEAGPDDEAAIELTRHGHAVGTPAFMSPEQAAGDVDAVDERSDVWSLGAVLFHLLTGHAPFSGDSASAVMSAVSEGRRAAIDPARADIPPELLAVVDRAMHPVPDERYPTATVLAEDLVAHQSGGRVSAYDYSPRERAARFARRHRVLLGAGLTVVAVLATALALVTRSYTSETEARKRAEAAQTVAEEARAAAEQASAQSRAQSRVAMFNLALAHVERAERLRSEGRLLEARLFAATSWVENPERSAVGSTLEGAAGLAARTAALFALAEGDAVVGRLARSAPLTAEEPKEVDHAVTAAGVIFAAADGSDAVQLRVGEATRRLTGHQGGAGDVALSSSGAFAATRDGDDTLRLWNTEVGNVVASWPSPAPWIGAMAVADDGTVAYVEADGAVVVREPERGKRRRVGPGPATGLAFSADGRWLAVGTHEGHAWLHDLRTGRAAHRYGDREALVTTVAFAPDDRRLAVADAMGVVVVHRVDGDAPIVRLTGHRGAVSSVAFSPDGRRLFTASVDGQVRGFDIASGARLFEIEGPGGHIYEVAAHDDELLAVSAGGVVRWQVRDAGLVAKPVDLENAFVRRDGSRLLFAHTRRAAFVTVEAGSGAVTSVDLPGATALRRVVAGGEVLVSLGDDGTVTWWSRGEHPPAVSSTRRVTGGWPSSLAVSGDGSLAAVGSSDGTITLLPRNEALAERRLQGHRRIVLGLEFSPDGTHLASAGYTGKFVLWDATTGEVLAELGDDSGPAAAVAFLDPQRVACAGNGGVTVWSGPAWDEPLRLTSTPQRGMAVDAAGGHVAALGVDGRVVVWSLRGPRVVLDVRELPSPQGVVFDEDGRLWLVRGRTMEAIDPGTPHLDVDADAVLRRAERAAGTTVAALSR